MGSPPKASVLSRGAIRDSIQWRPASNVAYTAAPSRPSASPSIEAAIMCRESCGSTARKLSTCGRWGCATEICCDSTTRIAGPPWPKTAPAMTHVHSIAMMTLTRIYARSSVRIARMDTSADANGIGSVVQPEADHRDAALDRCQIGLLAGIDVGHVLDAHERGRAAGHCVRHADVELREGRIFGPIVAKRAAGRIGEERPIVVVRARADVDDA